MKIPLAIPRIARRILPVELRVRLRKSASIRRVAAALLSGTAHCSFPDSEFQLFFDGYRNIGLGSSILCFEQQEREFVRKLLMQNRPRVLWDIGANIGVWSLFLTGTSRADSEITCFEPDPDNLKLLWLNMERNKIANWTIRPVAVSNEAGSATFFADPVCGSTGSLQASHDFIGQYYHAQRTEFQVKLTTVDAEVAAGAQPPQFIKIDVEGHELEVLEGALDTLKKSRPMLILETTRKHEEIASLFRAIDYQLIDLEGRPIDSPQFNTLALPREVRLPC